MKLQYVVVEEQIADVLTKPLARLKFEYFREKLNVLQIRFPPRESDETHSHSDMVRGLVPSMSDMSASHSIEQDRCKGNYHSRNGGTWSVTRNTQLGTERSILMSRSDVRAEPFCHGERIWFLPCQI